MPRIEVNAMPMKPKRPCRYSGCPKLTNHKSGYCEEHRKLMQRHYEHFARGYDHHKRYDERWRKIRNRYIKAHPLCERCYSKGKYVMAALVHHKLPLSNGGTNDEENLQSLCISCHEKIHKRTRKRHE